MLNNVAVEQIEETKLLAVILDCTLSWTGHIDSVVVNISVIKSCLSFLTPQLTKQVFQNLVLSHLDYCSKIWSGATKKDVGKLNSSMHTKV